ncbi:UDP-2,3-diacylglucosamine diphosphatase [Sphingobacteriales bacterium UPWRP_1]|nr:UDP-2,3-diacylglucosamine hydrolase [Sphingobacteriales bacterium TSM_CSS]PSJ75480.1 UDP-2,3-diacylglucosamine diphosphatase [Sphingobacteriales bacterium UPWRP_1]
MNQNNTPPNGQKAEKVYFVSDFHLGVPNAAASLEREKKFVRFLNTIQYDATRLYILGDLFDFWFEYKTVVPKGYVRVLGKLAELADGGLPVYFFTGNHDLWMFGYFEQELGIPVYHRPIVTQIEGKTFMIGHGDGLGPNDKGYKILKKYLFTNRLCQRLLGALHPDWGIGLASFFSKRSRIATGTADEHFLGEEGEWLIAYTKRKLQTQPIDFFVFGHRHLPLKVPIYNSLYINSGDWIKYNSYALYQHQQIELKYFTPA